MTADRWIWGLAAAWGLCFVLAFAHAYTASPAGDVMARIMGSIGIWALWQIAAMGLAIVVFILWLVKRTGLAARPRRIGYIPISVNATLWAGVAAWIGYLTSQGVI